MSHDAGTKALVTGGGGFLGKALIKGLVEEGFDVTSFSRGTYPDLERIGVRTVQGDITDASLLTTVLKDKDVVFHTAARVGFWGKYEDFHRVNVQGTMNILAACRRNGVKYLVHTSSPSVIFDGKDMEGVDESVPYSKDPGSNYSRTKQEAEKLVLRSSSENLRTIALRPHLIWGPGDQQLVPRLMDAARKGRLKVIGDRTKKVDTVYIDNAVRAHILAFKALRENDEACGRPFFITNGEPMGTWDLIDRFLELDGIHPVKGRVPLWAALAGAGALETVHWLLRKKGEPMLTRFLVKELSTSHWFDIGAAKRELGYVPKISIDEGLRRYERTFE